MKPVIRTIENPTLEQISLIRDPVKAYNKSKVGEHARQELTLYAYEEGGVLLGGIYGWFAWGWLYIDLLWVEESVRYLGLGSELLAACEQRALSHNVHNVRLNTSSFQALDFYQKNGYEIFAQIDIVAPNGSKQVDYFLKKGLKP
jgi:ribosomal protein S18 acetylase RimI-like enzyme